MYVCERRLAPWVMLNGTPQKRVCMEEVAIVMCRLIYEPFTTRDTREDEGALIICHAHAFPPPGHLCHTGI